jgi:cytochrome c5
MASSQQNAAVTAFVVVAALAVLAVFPGADPADTPQGASSLQPVSFVMPEETTPAELADPQAELVVSTCTACHSLEYITTQPRGMGEKFWHDEVTKMVKVYGAPIEPADADAITAILAKRFG